MINNFDGKISTFFNTLQTIFSRPSKEKIKRQEAVFKPQICPKEQHKDE